MSKCQTAVLIILAAITVAGCTEQGTSLAEPSASTEAGTYRALRAKDDLARGRRWELGWGAAYAYDVAGKQLIRRIPLSGASLAGAREACLPDMVLSRSGALIVSSNAQPILWRISPERYELERFEIALDSDQDQDVGFSGLAWGADERTLYAVSAAAGTLWRIDIDTAKATKIALSSPIHGACGLALEKGRGAGRPAVLVAWMGAGDTPRRIALAPDATRAEVTSGRATELAEAR